MACIVLRKRKCSPVAESNYSRERGLSDHYYLLASDGVLYIKLEYSGC